jgi:hypothetical protein
MVNFSSKAALRIRASYNSIDLIDSPAVDTGYIQIGRIFVGRKFKPKKSWWCEKCFVEVYNRRCLHCGKLERDKA